MVLYVKSPSGKQKHFVIHGIESCEKLFQMYPQAEEIVANSSSLEEGINSVASYLARHNMDAWIEETDMKKSVRGKLMSIGLAAATALSPNMISPKQSSQFHFQPPKPTITEFGKAPEDRFLWSIMQCESSGGRNTAHPIAGRIHNVEDRAIGKWGLLRPTVQEVIGRHRIHNPIPDGDKLASMTRNDMEDFMKAHPEVELSVARALAHHVIRRQKGDLRRSAYAWLNGHNKHYNEIQDQALNESSYVKKFKDAYHRNPFKPISQKPIAIHKTEGPAIFKERLLVWMDHRTAETRDPQPTPSNYAPDRGRQREKELDQKPAQNPAYIRPFLHQKIKDAKEGRKS